MSKRFFASLITGTLASTMAVVSLSAPSMAKDADDAATAKRPRPHMDLAFCIDTTGSMGSEIEMVKQKTKEIVAKLASGKPAPVIRVGLVAYRDRGDQYVTKVFQFTDDIDHIVKDIASLQAAGGGDGPESVNEALHVAVNDLTWSKDTKTAKLLFLIGDAEPHFYPKDFDWKTESKKAISQGIQINTIACSGLESQPRGMEVFKEIAHLADGKFDSLAYRQEVATRDGHSEVVISSAGAVYKAKPGAGKDWKESVARGALMKADVPAAAALSAPLGFAGATGGGGAMKSMRMAAPSTRAASFVADRKDSNLDELVLDAARSKAKQSLKVDYSK